MSDHAVPPVVAPSPAPAKTKTRCPETDCEHPLLAHDVDGCNIKLGTWSCPCARGVPKVTDLAPAEERSGGLQCRCINVHHGPKGCENLAWHHRFCGPCQADAEAVERTDDTGQCSPDCPKHVYHHADEMCPGERSPSVPSSADLIAENEKLKAERDAALERLSAAARVDIEAIHDRLAKIEEIARSSDSYVPQDMAAQSMLTLAFLDEPGKPNNLGALIERAAARIQSLESQLAEALKGKQDAERERERLRAAILRLDSPMGDAMRQAIERIDPCELLSTERKLALTEARHLAAERDEANRKGHILVQALGQILVVLHVSTAEEAVAKIDEIVARITTREALLSPENLKKVAEEIAKEVSAWRYPDGIDADDEGALALITAKLTEMLTEGRS